MKHKRDSRRTDDQVNKGQIHYEPGPGISNSEIAIQAEPDQNLHDGDGISGTKLGPPGIRGFREIEGEMSQQGAEGPQCCADQRQDLEPTGGLAKEVRGKLPPVT